MSALVISVYLESSLGTRVAKDKHGMIHLTQIVRKDCEKLIQW